MLPSNPVGCIIRVPDTVTKALSRRHLEERAPDLLPAAQPVCRVVGLAGGLGQTIFRAASENELDGTAQIYPVPYRDVDRRDPVAGPHGPPHDLPAVHHVRGVALLHPGLLELADEHRLGAPDRGNVE